MAVKPPEGLEKRGAALWRELSKGRHFDPAAAVLAAEACRIADRLERLDRLLRGDISAWAVVDVPEQDKPLVLIIGSALTEARQQANALRQIVATLGMGRVEGSKDSGRSALDDLAKRRAARGAATSNPGRPAAR